MGDYKLMSWCYEVQGVAGGNVTRPIACDAESSDCDPEFKKGPVLYNLRTDIGASLHLPLIAVHCHVALCTLDHGMW